MSSGQPRVENGQRAEENQVSSTSGSWVSRSVPASATASSRLCATMQRPSSVYQAGIWCPHQSWREMHQRRMLVSQCSQVLSHESGTSWVRPSRTAASAWSAMLRMSQNHWVETSGSIGSPLRWLCPTLWVCGSTLTRYPSSRSRATIFSRASKRSSPAKSGAGLGGHARRRGRSP